MERRPSLSLLRTTTSTLLSSKIVGLCSMRFNSLFLHYRTSCDWETGGRAWLFEIGDHCIQNVGRCQAVDQVMGLNNEASRRGASYTLLCSCRMTSVCMYAYPLHTHTCSIHAHTLTRPFRTPRQSSSHPLPPFHCSDFILVVCLHMTGARVSGAGPVEIEFKYFSMRGTARRRSDCHPMALRVQRLSGRAKKKRLSLLWSRSKAASTWACRGRMAD